MRLHCIAAVALLALIAAQSAQAQRQNDEWMCEDGVKGMLQVDACTRTIKLFPSEKWYRYRAVAFESVWEFGSAVADFTEVLKSNPDDRFSFEQRGASYNMLREYQWAIRDFQHLLSTTPDDRAALMGMGIALAGIRRDADASQYFAKALAVDPASPRTWNDLCWTKALQGVHLDDALGNCNKALALVPDSPGILDSRALANFQLGNYQAAIADGGAALSKDAKKPSSLFVRGLAKLHGGDKAGGDADIAAATTLAPGIAETFAAFGVTP